MAQVVTQISTRTILDQLSSGYNLLTNNKIDLFINAITPSAQSVLADFDIPNNTTEFAGYAQQSVSYSEPVNNTDLKSSFLPAGEYAFIANADCSCTVYGYVVSKSGTLVYAELLSSPKVIAVTGDGVVVPVDFNYSGT